ncbi:hypothetical protein PJO47_29565, partial [Mycobacterium kansasii]
MNTTYARDLSKIWKDKGKIVATREWPVTINFIKNSHYHSRFAESSFKEVNLSDLVSIRQKEDEP